MISTYFLLLFLIELCNIILTMIALIIIGYIVLASLLVYLSIMLSNYVDMLDKSTKISGALLGGVLLAAVTSLPELFTTLTAVIGVGDTGYVLGNILGSDIFDIIVLAFLFILFIKNTLHNKISKSNYLQFIFLISMFIVITISILLPSSVRQYFVLGGWFNWLSLLIIVLYVISLFMMEKTEDKEDSKEEIKLSIKQILIRFSICSVLLIGCSIGVTFISDLIVKEFEIDPTAAGAILLGIMTSLPEVISTFNLFYRKNINAGVGNMVGSAVFNMIIITLSELVSIKSSVFIATPEVYKLMILGSISIVSCLIAMLFKFIKIDTSNSKKIVAHIGTIVFSLISVTGYILYLALPNSMFAF